ncbi:zinc ribbon domain-containing protein [Pseudoflavonifractor sp. MSJ-37]|uniref:zinc ribbon domain-containing protein n=1 Tax=Pseudoflavonifractor sp. MSJ-37 TaxID=2841531 RepID=UPI00209ECB8B|nr:zinc ribbon domain-containing protein [Pseudoflavonifractor sp. MSJ-37]
MYEKNVFCQSCAMPIGAPSLHGTEADGTLSPHYCKYCYQNGTFTGDMTMEQMIDFCVPIMVQAHPEMSADQARSRMAQTFPKLLRWQNEGR